MYSLKQYKKLLKCKGRVLKTAPNYFLSKFYKKSLNLKNKPFWAQIEPTKRCNLNCKMCSRLDMNSNTGDMSFENFKIILDKLPCLFGIMLQGLGEPLINNDFFKMVEYANKNNIITVTTSNGTLITSRVAEKIINTNLDTITISIDGATKETYEKIRIGASFENTIKNIKNLIKIRNIHNKNLSINIVGVIMKKNIHELSLFVDLTHDLGADMLVFQNLGAHSLFPDFTRKQLVFDKDIEMMKNLTLMFERAKELNVKVKLPSKSFCDWPWFKIYVTWDGFVTPCCVLPFPNKKYIMGNILNQDFDQIWNNKKYLRLRKLLLNNQIPSMCIGCNKTS